MLARETVACGGAEEAQQGDNMEGEVEKARHQRRGAGQLRDVCTCQARKCRLLVRELGDALQDLDFKMSILRALWRISF